MARSSFLAVLALWAVACTAGVVPPTSAAPRFSSPTPFDESTLNYERTARAFVTAFNGARPDEALALIDERFAFGGDCDYERSTVWSITDRDSVRNWLQVRLADHDRIEVTRFVDVPAREHAIGIEIARSSDTIRAHYAAGTVRPKVPLVLHFSLDGLRIAQLAFAWSTRFASFVDCA